MRYTVILTIQAKYETQVEADSDGLAIAKAVVEAEINDLHDALAAVADYQGIVAVEVKQETP